MGEVKAIEKHMNNYDIIIIGAGAAGNDVRGGGGRKRAHGLIA